MTPSTVPPIGLGVYLVPPDHTATLVYQALKIGYRIIDTAQIYRNEAEVSAGVLLWLQEDPTRKRSEVYIVTKIWDLFHGSKARDAIAASIKKMCIPGVDYIDYFLIHSPNSNKLRRLQTYSALQEAKAQGYVQAIGVSNYGIHHLEEIFQWPGLIYPPCVNQIEAHPWLIRHELAQYCKRKNIIVQAYSPLAKGRKFSDPLLNRISSELHKSNAQVLIRWSIQMGYVPLPKTLQLDRLISNFQVWDFELSESQMKELSHENHYFVTGWDPTLYTG